MKSHTRLLTVLDRMDNGPVMDERDFDKLLSKTVRNLLKKYDLKKYSEKIKAICDQYGWIYGFIAAIIHYSIVTLVPSLHGGFALYNGGFTAVFVCIILVPVLEKFCKTKEARKAAKAESK